MMIVGPRIADFSNISDLGRNIDIVGLSRAVISMCAERQMREIDSVDQGRTLALAETARLWCGVVEKMAASQPGQAKEIEKGPKPAGTPTTFDIGAFERRKEVGE